MLALREHRPDEALVRLDKFLGEAQRGVGRVSTDSSPALQASRSFVRAQLCAELGRADEARRDFTKGRAALKLALGDKPGHDRGEVFRWRGTYDAESWQREAEAVFKAKGIPCQSRTRSEFIQRCDDFRMNPNREEVLFALALEKPAEKRPAFWTPCAAIRPCAPVCSARSSQNVQTLTISSAWKYHPPLCQSSILVV